MKLADKLLYCQDGDTIYVDKDSAGSPLEPIQAANLPNFGAPFVLRGKKNIRIKFRGGAGLYGLTHGNILALVDCENITLEDPLIVGQGKLTKSNPYYFAGLLLHGQNRGITIIRPRLSKLGNHGIGSLYGDRSTIGLSIYEGVFEDIGNYAHFEQKADGAAIADGGCDTLIFKPTIRRCLRGIELEADSKGMLTQNILIDSPIIQDCDWQSIVVIPTHKDASLFRRIVIRNPLIKGTGKAGTNPDIAQTGIYIGGGTGIQIEGASVSDIGDGCGILLRADWADVRNCSVRGGYVTNASRHSIGVTHGAVGKTVNCMVEGVQVTFGQGRGIYNMAEDTLLSHNIVTDCAYVGIHACVATYEDGNLCLRNQLRDAVGPVTQDPWLDNRA